MNAFRQMNPARLARFEKRNYVYYYRRRWLKLLVVSILLVKEAYQLSIFQAAYGAYLMARAEMAFAPFPDNNLPLARSYIRRFYKLIKRVHHGQLDVEQAAERELNWWIVHRKLFANEQNQELVNALADLLVVVYQIDPQVARASAEYRAKGMLCSDLWVRQGLDPSSILLIQEEEFLCQSYTFLKSGLI